jgi:hypothetical protein
VLYALCVFFFVCAVLYAVYLLLCVCQLCLESCHGGLMLGLQGHGQRRQEGRRRQLRLEGRHTSLTRPQRLQDTERREEKEGVSGVWGRLGCDVCRCVLPVVRCPCLPEPAPAPMNQPPPPNTPSHHMHRKRVRGGRLVIMYTYICIHTYIYKQMPVCLCLVLRTCCAL